MLLNHEYLEDEYAPSINSHTQPSFSEKLLWVQILWIAGFWKQASDLKSITGYKWLQILQVQHPLSIRAKFLNSYVSESAYRSIQQAWCYTYGINLRRIIKGGRIDNEGFFRYKINNGKLYKIYRSCDVSASLSECKKGTIW